jgi:hypothetical protein
MEHTDVRHRLSEYIDGSISADEKTAIDGHLKTCTQCSDALHELRKTIELVKTIDDAEPPEWMTQKIMANVRAEAGKEKGLFERFFLPFSIKLPIQAVAIVFLAVTAFYIYRSIQPASVPSDAPVQEFASRKEAAKDRFARSEDHALRAKQAPQAPEYKALDMKQEYEKPAAPKPMDKAEAPAPAKAAEQPALAKKETTAGKVAAAPQAGAPAMMREQSAVSNESGEHTESKRKSMAIAEGTTAPANRFEQVVQERYPDDKPKVVVTFVLLGSNRVKRAEERFNSDGERHGLQREYYESGQVKTEAQYGHGKLEWYREFQPDGVKKIGKSDFDWFWLKK